MRAFDASLVNAAATFLLSLAEVSMRSMSGPRSLTNFYAASVDTTLPVSPRSALLPITINGNVSGCWTILFYRKDSCQLSILSNDALLVISYTKKQQSAPL